MLVGVSVEPRGIVAVEVFVGGIGTVPPDGVSVIVGVSVGVPLSTVAVGLVVSVGVGVMGMVPLSTVAVAVLVGIAAVKGRALDTP